jgi:hypothetical protein
MCGALSFYACFFLGFCDTDNPVRRYSLKQNDKNKFFVPFYIQLKKEIKQICSKQSLILKNYSSNVVVFIQNRVK